MYIKKKTNHQEPMWPNAFPGTSLLQEEGPFLGNSSVLITLSVASSAPPSPKKVNAIRSNSSKVELLVLLSRLS